MFLDSSPHKWLSLFSGCNGIEFGNDGELYIQNGGNTNAGVPGKLSSREQQDEDWFSAATLVARGVNKPGFNGNLQYNAGGFQTGGFSVEVFAPGMRNPFDVSGNVDLIAFLL